MSASTQDTKILETLIDSGSIDMKMIEIFLKKIQEKKVEDAQNSERNFICTIQDVRARLNRLSAIFCKINFALLWKDRVCQILGRDAESLRWELYQHRSKYMLGKYTASFYEAVSFNDEYLQVAINVVMNLEKERGIKCVVYKAASISKEQEKEFCIEDVTNMSNTEFSDWFSRRLDDFALMFNIKKYSNMNDLYSTQNSAESIFKKALIGSCSTYDKRIYGNRFEHCGFELYFTKEKGFEYAYNCEAGTPCYKICRKIIREYIVIVARQCLVI